MRATRLMRHEDGDGGWQLLLARPEVELGPDVLVLEDYVERLPEPVRHWHPPVPLVPLILNFGPPYVVADAAAPERAARYGSFTAGLGGGASTTESPGSARCVQVNLSPAGARRVLGVPMDELAGRVVPLEDVLGVDAHRIEERLAESADPTSRLALVEAFLAERLAAAEPVRPDVAFAWRRIVASGGRARVADLAAELGCSRKHLAARFRHDVGLAPKAAARLVRFDRARQLLDDGVAAADVAFSCGYADQPHLVNEFRSFAGMTPSAYVRSRQVRFLQDAGELAA